MDVDTDIDANTDANTGRGLPVEIPNIQHPPYAVMYSMSTQMNGKVIVLGCSSFPRLHGYVDA